MNELNFAGLTALVAGGSSGIGNGVAQGLRLRGASVEVWGTRPDIESYSKEAGSNLEGLTYASVDLSDAAAATQAAERVETLDILVLSQGTVAFERAEFELETWRRVMQVNLDSVMAVALACKPQLQASRGSLIVISSVTGFRASIGNPAYAASKAAVINLVKTLGAAWAAEGIRVNGIAPGYVATKLTRQITANPRRKAAAIDAIPMRRLGTPQDMSGVAAFLASPLAAYVTGQTIIVDGGMSLL